MIHGQTKIELYNPNTKIKNIYRDENTFQSSFIAKYMRGLGQAGARMNDYTYKSVLGGLFLFKNAITEGTQYMPSSNKMIGNGAYGVVNNSTPTEMGSFNSVESSESTSAITQVYDFTTAQGNGTISCVCLTSAAGGFFGYGNASNGVTDQARRNMWYSHEALQLGAAHAYRDNVSYLFAVSNGTLTVTKTYHPITKGFIRAGMTDIVTKDLTSYAIGTLGASIFAQDGDYVYFTFYQSVNIGGTGKYYKYDLTDDTLTEETFTNSAPIALRMDYTVGYAHGLMFITTGDYSSPHTYVFNMSNSVLVKDIDYSYIRFASRFTNGLIFLADINQLPLIYNITNDTILPTNGAFNLSYSSGIQYFYDVTTDTIWRRGYNENLLIGNNPLYLATINNLQTAVTKTAAQTMKVTYTLTEEEPE